MSVLVEILQGLQHCRREHFPLVGAEHQLAIVDELQVQGSSLTSSAQPLANGRQPPDLCNTCVVPSTKCMQQLSALTVSTLLSTALPPYDPTALSNCKGANVLSHVHCQCSPGMQPCSNNTHLLTPSRMEQLITGLILSCGILMEFRRVGVGAHMKSCSDMPSARCFQGMLLPSLC